MLIAVVEDECPDEKQRGPQEEAQAPVQPARKVTLRDKSDHDPGEPSQGQDDSHHGENEHPARIIAAALRLLILLSTISCIHGRTPRGRLTRRVFASLA